MLRKIGCRAHDYGTDTLVNLGKMIQGDGYQTIQLALKKALIDVNEVEEGLNEQYANLVCDSLKEQGIDVSVLGIYLNYAHPDHQELDYYLSLFKKHIKLANDFGCRVVGTETGSLDPNYKPHIMNHGEEGYKRFRNSIESLLPYAHKYHTFIAVEAVAHHIINTPTRMKRLIDDLKSPSLKVICDITNIINHDNYKQQDDLINEMFDLLEEQILVVHIKDFVFVNGKKKMVPLGKGILNIELLAKRIKESKQMIDVLVEDVKRKDLKNTFLEIKKYFDSM